MDGSVEEQCCQETHPLYALRELTGLDLVELGTPLVRLLTGRALENVLLIPFDRSLHTTYQRSLRSQDLILLSPG